MKITGTIGIHTIDLEILPSKEECKEKENLTITKFMEGDW